VLPIVKLRLIVNHDYCNIPLPPEQVCGIHVLNEGSYCCNNQPIYLVLGLLNTLRTPKYYNYLSIDNTIFQEYSLVG
jgi:hypothetical protein